MRTVFSPATLTGIWCLSNELPGIEMITMRPSPSLKRIASAAIRKAIRYIDERFTQQISSRALADSVGLSHGHFCRTFKRATGVDVTGYVTRLRLKKACESLSTSNEAINLIALRCGFCSLTQFNRMFRRFVQKTPTEYRAATRRAARLLQSSRRHLT